MTPLKQTLGVLASVPDLNPEAIASFLDELSHGERVRETRRLPRRCFARLYEVASRLELSDLIPEATPQDAVVLHHGINSMPLFRVFQKPMYRHGDSVAGRNVHFWSWITGPGYFTTTTAPSGEWQFDYVSLPQEHPPGWRTIRSNAAGLSFFVFRGVTDTMRRLSRHVSIGKAYRNGKHIGEFFLLVREDSTRSLPASGG